MSFIERSIFDSLMIRMCAILIYEKKELLVDGY